MTRSPIWKELFNGFIELAKRGKKIRFMMQIDTQSWKIPNFVEMDFKSRVLSRFCRYGEY